MRAALLTTFLVLVCACGDDDGLGPDAGGGIDGGSSDAGGTDDAGSADDAGTALDAGTVGDAGTALDAGTVEDAGTADDAGAAEDAGTTLDAGTSDAGATPDAGAMRSVVFPGFCPSTATGPGLYRGTLGSNLNDLAGCGGSGAPGRDGALRVELEHGQTLTATYRHAGDGVLYLLDSCPVLTSCLEESDGSVSSAETLTWTNTGAANTVYLVLDSAELGGPQTFELDLAITGP